MGWEKPYVFVDFTAAANLGGKVGFVADRHRIAVCLTRQTQFLVVMADTRCTIVQNEDPDAAALPKSFSSSLTRSTSSTSQEALEVFRVHQANRVRGRRKDLSTDHGAPKDPR